MAHNSQLPCDGEGICMVCKNSPANEETLTCKTCATPWHVSCLSSPPETLDSTIQWDCPDCSPLSSTTSSSSAAAVPAAASSSVSADLIAAIRAIEADGSLTEQEKAKRRQQLMSGAAHLTDDSDEDFKNKERNEVFDLFDGSFNCSFCMHLPDRPVTTPCGHNFCLKCFQKWIGQGKRSCAKCRDPIPSKMASLPRINSALVAAIRMAKMSKSTSTGGPMKVYHFVHNQNRPDKAYTTERAKRAGKANACSGKIFVTVPPDHFGPILSENDPERKQGVLVGECWEDRMECRQWGAHLPHVAGIAGQSEYGAQSVALSGGYEDDEDHGEWFLYTGSGGRDLSGNKRTNKEQSFDQKFDKYNEALRVSCKKGYPVRVVRSYKEKRSSYAPETGVRYDGIYRIEKCWRKIGIQGFKVCRYLFVRCDNEPAPWTSDEHGDRPRPLPVIKELKKATDVTERKESPSWDYSEQESCWKWIKSPPLSRKPSDNGDPEERKRARRAARQDKNLSVREKLLKEFSCLLCRKVMNLPLTTPCAHNFCKPCLEGAFEGQEFLRVRNCEGRRTLRTQKNVMKCPSCPNDISDFLQNPQVNRELMDVIKNLQSKSEENVEEDAEIDEDIDNDVQEESEESSGTVKSEAVVEDIEVGCENLEMLNGGDKNTQNTQTEIKHKQTQKQKKNDGKKDNESPANAVNGEGEDQLNPEMPKNDKEDLPGPATDSTSKSTRKRKKVNEIKHKQIQKQKKKDGEKNDESPPDAVNGDEKGDKNMENTRTEIKHKQKKNDGKDNESLVNAVNGEGEDELNPEMPKNDKEDLPGPATDSTRKRKKVNEIKHKQTQKQKKNDGEKNDESPPDAVNGDGEGDKNMQNTRTKIKHKQKKNDGKKNNESPVNTVNGEGEDKLNPEMPKNDKEDLPGPSTDSTSRSTRKRKKVNEIKHKHTQKQKKNDGEKNDESPPDAVNRDGKGELNTETPKNDNENLKGPATDSTSKNTRKRKKGNDPESGLKVGGVKTRSMKSKELANVGNDSPSGPSSAHSEKSQEKQKYKRKKTGNQASGSELGGMKTRAKKL